jgi:valyl-tRNA synthetase
LKAGKTVERGRGGRTTVAAALESTRTMMDKTFEPAAIEARIAARWEEAGVFRAGRPGREGAEPYTIVIPPPNVTGVLHMGHALNNTLQDVLCRFERMRGKDVLWQPGTDHAGIATQMVVERQLMERQEPGRRELGREAFLDKVWAWKAESAGSILQQLRRLGASCDWSRERFTMGDREDGEAGQMQRAVLEFFVRLHEAGLLYRDKRLVNWDPRFQTAISDLEVEQVEVKGSFKWERPSADDAEAKPLDLAALGKLLARQPGGHLYHFDYPLADGSGSVTVATTRPETMLGDTAVAVHPDDERYRHLVGRMLRLPLVNRLIPIVADTYSDPEKGTGAVKITPAHDFNDFDVGKRQNARVVNIFDSEAQLHLAGNAAFLQGADPLPEVLALNGQDRFFARLAIIRLMARQGLLARIEPTVQQVPHGDRSNVPIEPYLTDQWYVDVKPLAERSMAAVREGRTRVIPEGQEANYFRWLENIEPWCISRQLWWGHQIPVWYGPDGGYVVARSEAAAREAARAKWGADVPLRRDEDVLDTWFSSALWPFSTLGWPDSNPMVARHYPNSVLVTAFDILFFWVARMMMAGLFVTDEVPFRVAYIHGLVRDEKGAKMSKSKGNVLDPLEVVDLYGADALRFTIAINASQGRDVKLGLRTPEQYRNFCTKLWNAARFGQLNGAIRDHAFRPEQATTTLARWVLGESARAFREVTAALEAYRFNEAAAAAYRFTWNTYCDWYLELAKPVLQGEESPARVELRAVTAHVLHDICRLLHPFMPFITEEIWALTGGPGPALAGAPDGLLCVAPWSDGAFEAADAETEVGFIVDLVSEIRSVRSEMGVAAGAQVPLVLVGADATVKQRVTAAEDTLKRLARLSDISFAPSAPPQSAQIIVRNQVAVLPLAGVIDIAAEKARLEKEIAKLMQDVAAVDKRLGNPDFVAKAPEEIIEENKERRETALSRMARVREALARLD